MSPLPDGFLTTSASSDAPALGRVLLLTLSLAENGGIERFNQSILGAYSKDRNPSKMRVVCVTKPDIQPPAGVLYAAFTNQPTRMHPPIVRNLLYGLAVLRAIIKFKPEIVLTTHVALAPIGRYVSKIKRAKHIVVAHGIEVPRAPKEWAKIIRSNGDVLAVSNYTRRTVAMQPGVSLRSIGRLILPVNDAFFEVSRPLEKESITFVSVARLEPGNQYKGIDNLILAVQLVARTFPDVRLRIIGDGQSLTELESLSAKLFLQHNITFLGRISDRQLMREFSLADVFVLPGRATQDGTEGEGFGLVFAEAAAAGLAVIAGAAGGSAEAIAPGETGLLVDGQDVEEIASSMLKFLSAPSLARLFGDQGRRRAHALHSTETFALSLAEMNRRSSPVRCGDQRNCTK